MTDQIDTLREDIAYIRDIAADDGRIPAVIGANFVAVGLIFGAPVVLAWAALSGRIDMPTGWTSWSGLISTAIYLPVTLWLRNGTRGWRPGPSFRIVAAIWSAAALAGVLMVACILLGAARLGIQSGWQFWAPICFALYGAAWQAMAIARRSAGWGWVAAGCYAQAVINALLIGGPDVLLGLGGGLIVWLAIPGLVMSLRGRAAAKA
jgi:hypothetical protein